VLTPTSGVKHWKISLHGGGIVSEDSVSRFPSLFAWLEYRMQHPLTLGQQLVWLGAPLILNSQPAQPPQPQAIYE
jgi:hypothetical protein